MFKLSPSDFAYLFEDCKHCYVLKVKQKIMLPSMPMPGVFSALNTRLQGNLVGKNLRSLSDALPDGIVVKQEGFVESVQVPDTSVFLKGKYDLLVENPDKSYTLVDLKISQPGEDKIEKYKTQLAAYKFALENPVQGEPVKITKLGLLVFYPNTATFTNNSAILDFPATWLEVPIDDASFQTFIKSVDELLAGELPAEGEKCKWCIYRAYFQRSKSLIDDINF